jgi:cysteinyl-tRNA synthetase
VPQAVHRLVKARADARSAKDWARSDELRAEIESAGYTVEDTPDGAVVRKAR